jgi:folate-binding protein YgfZ
MFVLRSAVTLEDISEHAICLGIIGQDAQSRLPAGWPELPQENYVVAHQELNLLIKLPGPQPRYLLICPLATATAIWSELSSRLTVSGSETWLWSDIQSGLPSVWPATVEQFVPQMLNLDLIGGVNFNKGCYPGQEIVARMHYLGKAKRRMFRLHSPQSTIPAPGTHLYLADGDGQSAGQVVIATPAADTGVDMLAVVQLAPLQEDNLRLGDVTGPVLLRQPLPYPVEDEI